MPVIGPHSSNQLLDVGERELGVVALHWKEGNVLFNDALNIF